MQESLAVFEGPGTFRRTHRSYMEIRVALLRAVRSESGPTRIVRHANVSWKLLNQFLPKLVAKGLILEHEEDGRRSYQLSQRGSQVLIMFEFVKEEISERSDPRVWEMTDNEPLAPRTNPVDR